MWLTLTIDIGVHKFSLTNLSEKSKQLEIWVKVCCHLRGRWKYTWSDSKSLVVVAWVASCYRASNNNREEDEDVRGYNIDQSGSKV